MPSYNKAKTLPKAINSVLMQRADFEYELLIVDDCSTDESYKIAQEFATKNADKIIVLKNERNLGQLHSMNGVYPLLQGVEYFCVLDPDDYYIYDRKFSDAVTFLDTHKDFTSYLSNCIIDEKGDERLWWDGKKQILDFDWNDYLNEQGIIAHTCAGIFRNVYFYKQMHQRFFEFTQNKDYGGAFSADAFRGPWHLKAGKARFVNNVEAVYVYNYEGEWSSISKTEQMLYTAQLFYAFADFFVEEREHFLLKAKSCFDEALCGFHQFDKDALAKNKDFILNYFEKIYLNPNLPLNKPKKEANHHYKVRILGLPMLTITQNHQTSKTKLFGKVELLKIVRHF